MSAAAPCPECAAPVAAGGSCQDSFHALLALEWEIMGGPGEAAHYLAVSSYALQHPASMGYRAVALARLRRNVAALLAGESTLGAIRRQVRREANGTGRVLRRPGEAPVRWPVAAWPMTVVDLLAGGIEGYDARAAAWATATLQALEAAGC